MDFVLVFLLILNFFCTGLSYVTAGSSECLAQCPPGYHKDGTCTDGKYTCKMCENNSFTIMANTRESCIRCAQCENHQRAIKTCTRISDVECVCKNGYYNASPKPTDNLDCQPCNCKYCKGSDNPDYKRKCCQRCLNGTECQRKCTTAVPTITTPSTTPSRAPSTASSTASSTAPSTAPSRAPSPSTTPSTSTSATMTAPRTITSNNPSIFPVLPNMNQMPWLVLLGVMVAFLVLFWLLLLFTKNPIRYPNCCLCWSANKNVQLPVEDPIFTEQHSHQGRDPTTLTLHISEQMPMMPLSQSPATPQHPAHIGPVLPGAEHRAARQDEQSEHWPAIVLYAIIKEVPLRRWKEFLRLLSVTDQHMERVELETSLGQGSMERQYQMLRLWSQRSSANLNDVFSALHYMDLSGCAQLLQENLEKLQWRPELKQGFTDHGFNGALQDT